MSRTQMLELVKEAVNKARQQKGIVPTPGLKPEGSCFAFPGGEFGNLFWSQLVPTTEGTGEWLALRFPDTLQGLRDYIFRYLS